MKFSVIIPVYNNEKHLDRCVSSVINQTYGDWHIVLVNDGSTDGSGILLDEYHKRYQDKITVLHQQNAGVLLARRAGMFHATGDYLLFLDSDDSWDLELLEKVNGELNRDAVDILFFGFTAINEINGSSSRHPYIDEKKVVNIETKSFVYSLIVENRISSLWTGVYKQSLLDLEKDYAPFKGVFKGEDLLQNLALIDKASSFLFVPECYYYYYFNPSGLSESKVTGKFLSSHLVVQNEVMRYLENWGVPADKGVQMFKGVYHTSLKRLMTDSPRTPKYSKDEMRNILQILTSGDAVYYLDNLNLEFNNILVDTCIWLLKKRRVALAEQYIRFMQHMRAVKRLFESRPNSVTNN